MIIGTGSLAKLLKDREGAILFCSGVGNSQCENGEKYDNERNDIRHLASLAGRACIFYFSTISINLVTTRYTKHKIEMENYIDFYFENYNIIRLGNIWECTNPNTFLNYLRSHPEAEVRDEIKYMIHAEELNMICQSLPLTGKHEISVFSEMLTVKECLKR